MWAKIFDPFLYNSIGMRENSYLVAAVIMFVFFSTFLVQKKLVPILKQHEVLYLAGELLVFLAILPLVIIFLRPINQFIYFQF